MLVHLWAGDVSGSCTQTAHAYLRGFIQFWATLQKMLAALTLQESVPVTIVDDDEGGMLMFELPTKEVRLSELSNRGSLMKSVLLSLNHVMNMCKHLFNDQEGI